MAPALLRKASNATFASRAQRKLPALSRRLRVRAQAEEPSTVVQQVVEEVKDVASTSASAAAAATPAAPSTPAGDVGARSWSFGDAMAFAGPAPEIVNSRLAMLGVLAALGAELATGESVAQQFAGAAPAVIALVLTFSVASLVPIFKGANLSEAFGPLTPKAELLNGRVAMIGLGSLVLLEAIKGGAFFA